MEEEEDSRGRGGTKEDGMQWVNLLRISLPHEQRRKVGGGGHTKGDETGEEGEGSTEGGVHSLTIWIYCFRNGGEGWRTGGGERGEDGEGGVTPSVSLVNPKAETLPDLPPMEVIFNYE